MKIRVYLKALGTASAAALIGYAFFARPRMLYWGASRDEVRRGLPGDEFIENARAETTRSITIEAPVAEVWPWLVQMGQGRGGFYSYDQLENLIGLDIHSADRIVPELQDLRVGDVIRLSPESAGAASLVMEVALLEPAHALVLRASGTREEAFDAGLPYVTWAFVVEPMAEGATRLIIRFRSDFKPTLRGRLLNKYFLELPHFVMERKTMLGIKRRAEGMRSPSRAKAA